MASAAKARRKRQLSDDDVSEVEDDSVRLGGGGGVGLAVATASAPVASLDEPGAGVQLPSCTADSLTFGLQRLSVDSHATDMWHEVLDSDDFSPAKVQEVLPRVLQAVSSANNETNKVVANYCLKEFLLNAIQANKEGRSWGVHTFEGRVGGIGPTWKFEVNFDGVTSQNKFYKTEAVPIEPMCPLIEGELDLRKEGRYTVSRVLVRPTTLTAHHSVMQYYLKYVKEFPRLSAYFDVIQEVGRKQGRTDALHRRFTLEFFALVDSLPKDQPVTATAVEDLVANLDLEMRGVKGRVRVSGKRRRSALQANPEDDVDSTGIVVEEDGGDDKEDSDVGGAAVAPTAAVASPAGAPAAAGSPAAEGGPTAAGSPTAGRAGMRDRKPPKSPYNVGTTSRHGA
jgi:hypothetical protein